MLRMYNYLQQKPMVGAITGISTGCLPAIQRLLTDDQVIKLVSGVAAWAGCAVALLTFVAWSVRVTIIIKNYKNQKS